MNYGCALYHLRVYQVHSVKDEVETAQFHCWFVSLSCQASVWLKEELCLLSASCPTYMHSSAYFLSRKSPSIGRNLKSKKGGTVEEIDVSLEEKEGITTTFHPSATKN